jgi:ribosome-binding protein aMBF1 (putative translation factor)
MLVRKGRFHSIIQERALKMIKNIVKTLPKIVRKSMENQNQENSKLEKLIRIQLQEKGSNLKLIHSQQQVLIREKVLAFI